MQETNPLEKHLPSWTPRRPSPKIARRLFGAPPRLAHARSVELWQWLTPVAACLLTFMFVMQGAGRHWDRPGNETLFASVTLSGSASNVQPSCFLRSTDANLEWNVWARPYSTGALARATAPAVSRVLNSIFTNR